MNGAFPEDGQEVVFPVHTVNAAPDGVSPDQWIRGVALIAAASLTYPHGNSTGNALMDARKFEKWIREGDA